MTKKFRSILFFFICLSLLSGCSKNTDKEKPQGVYSVYYLDQNGTKLVSQDYKASNTEPEKLLEELLVQLRTVPANIECQVVLPEKVQLLSYRLEKMLAYLYFDNNYVSMDKTREILARAALARTLIQVEGVDYISIYSGDQPLLDFAGNPIGIITASDFVENTGEEVNAYQRATVVLYFANSTGDKLIESHQDVVYSSNIPMEKLVIEQLIKGPDQEGLFPTLPQGLKILNVSVADNICYINLDGTFLTSKLEVRDYIPIYSIVNSLSELSNVNKVQITVNGSKDLIFRESISLNTIFERNLDYIGGIN